MNRNPVLDLYPVKIPEAFPRNRATKPCYSSRFSGLLLQDSPVSLVPQKQHLLKSWRQTADSWLPSNGLFLSQSSGLMCVTSTPPTWTRKEKDGQMERQRVSRRISLIYFTKKKHKTKQMFTNWNKYGSLKLNGKSITCAVKLLDWKSQFPR